MSQNNTVVTSQYPGWVIALHVVPLVITIVGTIVLNLPVFVTCVLTDFHRKKPVNVWLNIMVFIHLTEGFFTLPIFLYRAIRSDFNLNVEKVLCVIYRFVYYTGSEVLAVFIVMISFDRLISVCFPLRYKTWMSARLAYVIASIVIFAVVVFQSVPFFFTPSGTTNDVCPYRISANLYLAVMFIFYVIPEIVLFVNYGVVLKVVRAKLVYADSKSEKKSENVNKGRSQQATRKIMLIVLVYMFTQLPYVIYYNLENFDYDMVARSLPYPHRGILKTFIKVASQVEGFCTPLVYFWMYDDFRTHMFDLFKFNSRTSRV